MNNLITKITIELDGKATELSVEQAKKLQEDLNTLFGSGQPVYIPYSNPIPYPSAPWPGNLPVWYSDRLTCNAPYITDHKISLGGAQCFANQ